MVDHQQEWNQTIMDNNFLSFEKDQINQLPIIKEDIEYNFMWMYTKDDIYSVKSGYNFIREWYQNRDQGTSNNTANHTIWKTLWNLNTILRHKDFLWRIINDSVPVRYALHSKGLMNDMFCPRCVTKMETLNHVIMECPFARKIWFGSNLIISSLINLNMVIRTSFVSLSPQKIHTPSSTPHL